MDKNLSGGGILIDWGVHIIDLIMYVTGENFNFVNVFNKNSQNGIESAIGIELQSKTGTKFTVDLSWLVESNKNENPLEIDFVFKNESFRWKKSGQILNLNSGNTKNFKKVPSSMYKYFLKTYLTNNHNEDQRNQNFKIYSDTIKVIDKIYSKTQF